jgi:recombinational DNA repair ATPase RecF/predicted phosphodiesterase
MKILIVSDVHINDYPQKNPTEKYRLYQTRLVADNIINVGKANGCDTIIFAGDIVEKSVIRPYVQAEVKGFLDKIMQNFSLGFIILGNHDLDAKSGNGDFFDSVLGVMCPSNLYYSDQKIWTCPEDNCTIAFSNWKPSFDLSWIKGKVDVLITHATICYSPSDKVKSQVMDDTKFDIAFCGDIHKPGQAGKFVSIGIPQRNKMGDSEVLSGIVFDTTTKAWQYVNMDPNNTLLKFSYTNQKNQEGYYPDINTWVTYKPDTVLINSAQNGQESNTIKEINAYIDNVLGSPEYINIHSEVLRNISTVDDTDIDFNFQITRVSCKNWRSIDDMTLYFSDLDKILLLGENGSGKTSLLSALRYSLYENRYIADFAQFGSKAKDSYAEIEFWYQGKLCILRRGGTWKLTVDGIEQKYNNKKEFEEDIHRRFPFIDYMDIYFYDADNNKLLGSLSQERKAIILSKFFRLDRVNIYNQIATKIRDLGQDKDKELKNKVASAQQLIGFTQSKLATIQIPQTPRETLIQYYEEGKELMKRFKEYSDYMMHTTNYKFNIEAYENRLVEKNKKLIELSDYQKTLPDLEECEYRLKEITQQLTEIGSLKTNLDNKVKEKERLFNLINRLEMKLGTIQSSICPTCNQAMNAQETERHRQEVMMELDSIYNDLDINSREIIDLQEKIERSNKNSTSLNNEMSQINYSISEIRHTGMEINRLNSEIQGDEQVLNNWRELLSKVHPVPEAKLPDNYDEIMASLTKQIQDWDKYLEYNKDIEDAQNIINQYEAEAADIREYEKYLSEYIDITSPSGKIFVEILSKLAEEFSDNTVTYKVEKPKGARRPDLIPFFHGKSGNLVSYIACSSGQRTVLDVNFLSKIMPRIGLLVMDEFLKHLDPQNHDVCIELIKSMNVGCTIISSHMESIASFNNRTFNLSLNGSGVTVISETNKD